MPLLRPTTNGNMYPGWWRWNPIGGCEHSCSYCYMRAMSKRTGKDMMTATGLREEYLNDNLGSGRKIFVCSSGDMWGEWVEYWDKIKVLERMVEYPKNEYMLLSKNPKGYGTFGQIDSLHCILGVTVESDIPSVVTEFSAAPGPLHRMAELRSAGDWYKLSQIMVSIEPALPFTSDFARRLIGINPDIVYIGRDTGHHNLPEPTDDELRRLVTELRDAGIDVHLKKSLDSLMPRDRRQAVDGVPGGVRNERGTKAD